MVAAMTWVDGVRPWEDAGPRTCKGVLAEAVGSVSGRCLGVESGKSPPLVSAFLAHNWADGEPRDVCRMIGEMRVITGPEEIEIMHQARQVAVVGSITVPGGFGGRIGDPVVVTDDGFACLTD